MDTEFEMENRNVSITGRDEEHDGPRYPLLNVDKSGARRLWIVLTYLARQDFPWPTEGHIGNRLKYDDYDYPDETPFYHSLEEYENLVPESEQDVAWIGRGDWLYLLHGGPDAIESRAADVPWDIVNESPLGVCDFRVKRGYLEPIFNELDEHVVEIFRGVAPASPGDD